VLAGLLTLSDDAKPAGRWTPLVEAMAAAADPTQQLEMVRAYWKLTAAIAVYRIAWDECQLLEAVSSGAGGHHPSPDDRVQAQVRCAQAAVQLEEAAGKLLAAQHDLALRMRLPEGAALPLPADKPHLGTYNTHFDQIYAAAAAPAGARFANRSLPLRRSLVDERAAVVRAAQDVLEAEQEAYTAAPGNFATLVSAMDRWSRERRTFLAAVMQYNDQIAEYAMNVPRAGLAPDSLVGMLIKAPIKLSAAPAQPGYATPATFNQPLPVAGPIPLPPPPADSAGMRREPTLAPPRPAPRRLPSVQTQSTPAATARNAPAEDESTPNEPALLPKDIIPGAEPQSSLPSTLLNSSGIEFGPHEANRQPLPASEPAAAQADPGLYSGLLDVAPAKRAQELAGLLNWNRLAPQDPSTPLSLEECLAEVPGNARPAAIAAYWRARQAIAGYQAVMQEIDQLDAAAAALLQHHDRPGNAEAMLQVRYARLSLEASRVEAQLTLLAEQFTLTQLARRPLDQPWLLPSTPPHGGGYLLKADAQPHTISDSFAFKRSTAVVPALHRSLQEQALAVVLADAQRVRLAGETEAGAAMPPQLLAAIEQQANQTRAFLATLTRYNTEIGDYALVVLPPQSPADLLVRAMVTPTTPGRQL
jgi:hypothetical protein